MRAAKQRTHAQESRAFKSACMHQCIDTPQHNAAAAAPHPALSNTEALIRRSPQPPWPHALSHTDDCQPIHWESPADLRTDTRPPLPSARASPNNQCNLVARTGDGRHVRVPPRQPGPPARRARPPRARALRPQLRVRDGEARRTLADLRDVADGADLALMLRHALGAGVRAQHAVGAPVDGGQGHRAEVEGVAGVVRDLLRVHGVRLARREHLHLRGRTSQAQRNTGEHAHTHAHANTEL